MRILVKIGGAQLEETGPRAAFSSAVAAARHQGHEIVIVHGGGNQIRTVGKAMGIEDRYHDGLRITDARTADVVLMVLGGLVNRTLVAALQHASVPAVGISGADGGSFTAQKLVTKGVDLGFVGTIETVHPQLIETLLGSGYVPVIATTAPGRPAAAGPFFNLNADHAASPLCRALRCEALLFLTDVPGVFDAQGQLLAALTPGQCDALVHEGTAKGGMIPKLTAARMALHDNPHALIKIAPGGLANAISLALLASTGTRLHMPDPTRLDDQQADQNDADRSHRTEPRHG